MRTQKSVYEMTDRELRAYKRQLRHRREVRNRCVVLLATICVILVGAISYCSFRSSAHEQNDWVDYKYYTNITVAYGDTLWDIADDYIDYHYYKDKNAYISEVCNINHLNSDAGISAGQKLIVPYYSDIFVR